MHRFLLIALVVLLSGCASFYDRAKGRFQRTYTDTTYQRIVLTVPKDSAVLRVKTDTTRIIETFRQGRATATIIREPMFTTVIANCDEVKKDTTVVVKTVSEKWGVDPKFEKQAHTFKWLAIGLTALLVIGVGAYLLIHQFRLSITRR